MATHNDPPRRTHPTTPGQRSPEDDSGDISGPAEDRDRPFADDRSAHERAARIAAATFRLGREAADQLSGDETTISRPPEVTPADDVPSAPQTPPHGEPGISGHQS